MVIKLITDFFMSVTCNFKICSSDRKSPLLRAFSRVLKPVYARFMPQKISARRAIANKKVTKDSFRVDESFFSGND